MVFLISLLQAFSQIISVAAVFPFLALAAEPEKFDQSGVGRWLLFLLPGKSYEQLLAVTGFGLIAAFFFGNGASMYGEFYRARFTWGFAHWLRMRMLDRMNARPYSWFLRQNSSVLIKKTTQDIFQFINGVLSPLIDGTSRLLVALALLAVVITAEPKIAFFIMLVLGVAYLLIFFLLYKFRAKISDELKSHWRGVFHQTGQFIAGVKPVRVHGVSSHFLQRIEENSNRLAVIQAWMPVIGNGPKYFIEPLLPAVMILTVLRSLFLGQNFVASLPGLGLIAMAGYRLLPAVQMLYSQLSNIQTMRYTLDEVYEEFLDVEEEQYFKEPGITASKSSSKKTTYNQDISDPLEQFQSEIVLQNINFSYSVSRYPVFKNINLTVRKNTSVAFIGETGSGKSTLVDLILGLHIPDSGQMLIDGIPLDSEEKIKSWQRFIGYVPQDIFLLDDTVARNIAFGIADEQRDDERIREVASMAQIHSVIEQKMIDSYSTVVGERGVRLSGGERQRIALARALYHRPEVLILDEATSALDNETEKRFMDVIYSLADELTILMVAHRLSTVARCNCKYVLKNGTFHGTT